jgi:hypothetical protein
MKALVTLSEAKDRVTSGIGKIQAPFVAKTGD